MQLLLAVRPEFIPIFRCRPQTSTLSVNVVMTITRPSAIVCGQRRAESAAGTVASIGMTHESRSSSAIIRLCAFCRLMLYECSGKNCPSGDLCTNRRFQKKQYVKELEIFYVWRRSRKRGFATRDHFPLRRPVISADLDSSQ